jgi:LuxR family maltose regulon positive regulatory protein
MVQRAKGRLDAALGTYQRALQFTAAPGRPVLPAAGFAYVGMADVAYQRGELDSVLQLLTEGIPLCRQDIHTNVLATGLTSLAWIRQVKGDPGGALRAIREAEEVAAGVGLLNPVPVQRARLQLAQGDLAGAARWVEELGLGAADGPSYSKEPEYLVLARVLLAQDLSDRALGLLGRLYELAAAQGRVGSIIEVCALQALALAARGGNEGAVPALAEALSLAGPQGHVRVFVDEGAPMAALIGRVISAHRGDPAMARDVPLEYLGRLARAFQRTQRVPAMDRQQVRAVRSSRG